MALLSVLDRIMVDAILPARIRAALGTNDQSVYVGRQPRDPRPQIEVLVRPVELEESHRTLTSRSSHHFELEVFLRLPPGGDGAGEAQVTALGRALDLIRGDLSGSQSLPWREDLPDLFELSCREITRDAEADDTDSIVGVLRLSLHFQGPGTRLAQPAAGGPAP